MKKVSEICVITLHYFDIVEVLILGIISEFLQFPLNVEVL